MNIDLIKALERAERELANDLGTRNVMARREDDTDAEYAALVRHIEGSAHWLDLPARRPVTLRAAA